MSEQFDIFNPPYQRGSATSKAAAQAIAPRAGSIASRVLTFLEQCGARGATREEIQIALRMKIQTVCSSCNGLRKRGFVGVRGERLTTGGNPAEVLVISELAK